MNKRVDGARYEGLVCEYLEDNGAVVLQKNFRCRSGEIDIIIRDGKYLVFTEVKFRSDERFGSAEAAVDLKKQKTISKVSDYYRKKYGISDDSPQRYDVVAVRINEDGFMQIKWHKNAFNYINVRNMRF